MRQSIALRQQLRTAIDDEIAQRIQVHQAKIARLKTARVSFAASKAMPPAAPLVMLAHGDSWFDYPLSGNSLSLRSTDVIAQLESMGDTQPVIANVSHHGDATTDEMSLPKQERMIQALQDPANWMESGKPDAILFSGGGNDIAGDQFCIFLDYAANNIGGLNAARFTRALGMIEGSYMDLFVFRDRYAPGVPVLAHCYDFPIPNGVHPSCAGPWLQPSLDYCGFNLASGTLIVHQALVEFRQMLLGLASNSANNFFLIDTQGTFSPDQWANELHPYPPGFKAVAQEFVNALKNLFPGRI